jgi:hypothetical protein
LGTRSRPAKFLAQATQQQRCRRRRLQ